MYFSQFNVKSHARISYENFLRTTILSIIFVQLFSSKTVVNGEEWALHIEDGEQAANALATRHNLMNLGEVLPESNIYHFSLKHEHRGKRSAEDISEIHEALKVTPEIKWIEHQKVLKRSKRVPVDRKKRQAGRTCVISTVANEEKESRRCVFPFEYKGKVYLQCTSDHSSNGREWCGTEVKSNGEVVSGQWGDCDKESVVCYTTKVVVEKESFGSPQPTNSRVPQTGPTLDSTNARQRLPVTRPRPRTNPSITSQPVERRPLRPSQSSGSIRIPPELLSKIQSQPKSSSGSIRLTPELLAQIQSSQPSSSSGSIRIPPELVSQFQAKPSSRTPPKQTFRLPPQQSSRLPPQQSSRIPAHLQTSTRVVPQQSSRLPSKSSGPIRIPPELLSKIQSQQPSSSSGSIRLTPELLAQIQSAQPSRSSGTIRIPPNQSQRLPPGFPPRQQAPPRSNAQGVPRQFLARPPSRPNGPQQQNFEPQILPPLREPVNPQTLSQQQIFALLNSVRRPPPEEDVIPANTPKLEELQTKWNDPLWPQMWFLNRGDDENGNGLDMNVEEAWKTGVSGKGVVVTILDDGVEWSHPDLEANYDAAASRDLNDRDADPFPRYDILNSNKHGTRCAGQVSAAANNSKCGVGIAYNSKIGGVRVLDGAIVDALEAEALSFNRNHIDIYSASWGPDDDGRTVDGPGPLASRALEDGILKGRNGLGSIFVWASGNGGKFFDNCNTDGYTTSVYTLSISSVSEKGLIPWYSEPCASSIATTYSSGATRSGERKVVTTDLRGKCTTKHTGTSASSPIASGIVALALEANKNLTWRDVQHLVIRSARPRGNLKANDWNTNGVGLHFSHSYGFGLIDAAHLVKNAKTWKTVPEQQKCTYKQVISQEKLEYLILPEREEMISLDVENAGCVKNIKHLEHFHIVINLSSTARRGDLSVSVISPMGTTSELLGFRPFDDLRTGFSLFGKWPMMSVHFWGENPVGKWKLVIKNKGESGKAILHDWYVILYGTSSDPQPDSPLKPNYNEATPIGDARKFGKNSSKVKFTNINKKQTLNNLAKICPDCFNSKPKGEKTKGASSLASQGLKPIKLTKPSPSLKQQGLKPFKPTNTETASILKTPKKSAGATNIAQVCPQCFKKKQTTLVVDENTSKEINDTLAEPPMIPENNTKEIETFDSFDDFSVLPDNLQTVVSSTDDSEGDENKKSTSTITDLTVEKVDSNEPDSSKENEPVAKVITETEIKDESFSQQIAMKNESTNKPMIEDDIVSTTDSSIEESEPRSLINDSNTETIDDEK